MTADLIPLIADATIKLVNVKLGLACLGAGIGIGLVGAGASLAVGRNPGASGKILMFALLFAALAETIAFYGMLLPELK